MAVIRTESLIGRIVNVEFLLALCYDFTLVLNLVLELLVEVKEAAKIPDILFQYLRGMVLRMTLSEHMRHLEIVGFPNAFAVVRSEWQESSADAVEMLIKTCRFEQHEIECFEAPIKEKRKRSRHRNSARHSTDEGEDDPSSSSGVLEPPVKKKRPEEIKAEQLNAVHEPPKIIFKGDPVEELIGIIKTGNWPLAEAGLEKLTSPSYLKNHMPSDFEKFFVEMITVALSEGAHINTPLKIALSQVFFLRQCFR
ncbi:unnamed protein product [Gongylonema pulchrum]|uniref:FRIGIDA-like protein n=1 Tax=Gongylonema pulchrum TaxID=637853 RepID=A0A183EEY5_9BILA|nr:unnamed protein product [Gongylonema pulchrum]